MTTPQSAAWLEPLSQREKEILFLIKAGLSNREIAEALYLSLETVKWYNKQAFGKLGVNSRTKAVAKAIEFGLLPDREDLAGRENFPKAHNLPPQVTPFIGREIELAEVLTLLSNPAVRLVTIIGPGGIGKTRLALAVAENCVEQTSSQISPGDLFFPDGVYFIPLTNIDLPERVFPGLAGVLNYQFEKGRTQLRSLEQQLLDFLKQKQMLLVMDNFEQLVGGAGLLADVLRSAPEIKILVTSRERLNLVEEHLYRVEGLSFPGSEISDLNSDSAMGALAAYPAIGLFLQSARRLQPGFYLTDEDLAAAIHICQQVEGMPLALELAASWVDILSITDIAIEIEHSYDFMHTGVRGFQERHRSVRAVFDSTWQRLNLEEQDIFAQLSLFQSDFSRESAQRVTAPVASLGLLASLTNKSLLTFNRKNGRFHIHELLRQYGADKIALRPDKAVAFRERFCDYFTSVSMRLGNELKGPRLIQAMTEIDADIQNIHAAWEWAVSHHRIDLLCQISEALGLYFQRRGRFQEGERLFGGALAKLFGSDDVLSIHLSDEEGILRARFMAALMMWQSNFMFTLGHLPSSDLLLRKCLALLERLTSTGLDVHQEMAFTMYRQGVAAMIGGDRHQARRLCHDSLKHYQACEDSWGSAMVLEQLCVIDWYLGDQISARQWGEESLHLRQELGDLRGIADSYTELSAVVADELDLEEALRYCEQAVRLYEELDDRDKIVNGVFNLGAKWSRMGDYSLGYRLQVKSYHMARDLNLRQMIPMLTCQLAYITNHLGSYDETRHWTDLCMPIAREMGDQRSIAVSLYSLGLAALSVGSYHEAYKRLLESAAMIQAMQDRRLLAMVLAALGRAAFGAGIVSVIKPRLYQALMYCIEVHSSQAPFETFMQIAFILCQARESWAKERAVELYSLATRFPYASNSHWLRDTAGLEIEGSFSELPLEVVDHALARGRNLEVWSTAAALQEELSLQAWSD